jgi:hypothetical protein
LSVVYQIHREGVAAPLTYAPLAEAWSDHMYYFATVLFKKSGRYMKLCIKPTFYTKIPIKPT